MRSQDDVQKIVIACNQYNVPIVPFGGATSIEGHTLAPNGGVRIDMSMMKQIKALHVEDMDVVVEPGIGWMELIDYLKPYGLFFPLDPGPGATIGGMCATSCSGSLAVRYGTMRDVISLQVVLGNGDVVKTAARARKSASGWFISGHWKDQRMMSFLWSFKFKLPLLWITNLIYEVALQSWRLELGNLGGWRWEILEAGPRKSWRMEVEFSVPNAELRLLEVFYHKIYKIFPPSEKIENINDQYWTLRAEEIPEEEKNLGPHDRLIHVYHFTKDSNQNQTQIQNFGDPFFLAIHEGETLAEVKARIQQKLKVPDEEFSKWNYAFMSLGRPEYLQESDVVASRFQRRDVYGAWEQYLGLEHSDTAPKRAYTANQNRHAYEKPVKIYN